MPPVDTSFLTKESLQFTAAAPPRPSPSELSPSYFRDAPFFFVDEGSPRPKVNTEKIQIPTFTDGHLVDVDVLRPAAAGPQEKLPVLVYIHGGGWVIPADDGHSFLATKIAGEAYCAVFFVHYSLSPEVKFPVALEECYSVLAQASDPANSEKFLIDPTRVAIGGDSAGGNLTAAVTLLSKQKNELKNAIKYQVLYFPIVGYDFESESYRTFGNGEFFLTTDIMKFFFKMYFDDSAVGNPLSTPCLATTGELTNLPPALLFTSEADVLRSEGEQYGRNLRKAGVPVTSIRVNGVLHGFNVFPGLHSEETLLSIDTTIAALRRVFHS